MSILTDQQLAQVKDRLEAERLALIDEVREDLEKADDQVYAEVVGRVPAESGDWSMSDVLADVNLDLVTRHSQALREVDAAFERLRRGTYGECIDCGSPIGFERLLVQPTAMRCRDCQERYEKTHPGPLSSPTAPRL